VQTVKAVTCLFDTYIILKGTTSGEEQTLRHY
jgi:hypothetical protein